MSHVFSVPLLVAAAVAAVATVSSVITWSCSPPRHHHLMARDHARAARHRANRRTA